MNGKNIKGTSIKLICAIVIAAVVVLNVAAQFIPETLRRFDTTASDSYTLSESAKEYLSSVSEKVTLYVIDSDGSDIKYEYLLRRIDALCENIDVKWTSTEDAEPQLKALGLSDNNIFFNGRYTYGITVDTDGNMELSYRDIAGADDIYLEQIGQYTHFHAPELGTLKRGE